MGRFGVGYVLLPGKEPSLLHVSIAALVVLRPYVADARGEKAARRIRVVVSMVAAMFLVEDRISSGSSSKMCRMKALIASAQ